MTTAMSLLNIMSFFHLVDDFVYLNHSSISEQINLFKHQSSVCVCVCVCACVNYVNYEFVYYVTSVFSITAL